MKPDRAIIRLSFPHPVLGNFFPVKVELEYPLGPDDHEHDALDHGKASAEEWFQKAYPPLDLGHATPGVSNNANHSLPTISKDTEPEDKRIATLIGDIYSCSEVKVLESYRIMAKSAPELKAAYDQQMKKLSNGLE